MKLPWFPWWVDTRDVQRPTRRRFLQMWAAAVLPKPPINIWIIWEILDWEKVGKLFYWALRKLPVRFFQYEKWSWWNWELVSFPEDEKPLIWRKIKSELEWYLWELRWFFWENSEILNYLDIENSYLQPEVWSYEANKEWWDIDGEWDILDLILHFNIPWSTPEEEYYIEINICPTEFWINEVIHIWDAWVILWRIDRKLWRITDEYEISLMNDKDIFKVLRMPMKDLLPVFKDNSWHKNYNKERIKQKERTSQEDRQLPMIIVQEIEDKTKAINLLLELASWEVEFSQEIMHRVWHLLAS